MRRSPPTPRLAPGVDLRTVAGQAARVRFWRGEGSYARVYGGEYSLTGAPCAVKVAKAEIPDAPSRLNDEQRLLAQLAHPQVVRLIDSGELASSEPAGVPFLVLEWLEGETLRDLVQARRRLALRQSLEILEAAAGAVAHIHSRGLTHGDVRAENLIVLPGRCAVLTDPAGVGTAAGDVRALGQALHLMLTGSAPGAAPLLRTAAGYNRSAVQLWERTQAPSPPSAGDLLAELRRLRASL